MADWIESEHHSERKTSWWDSVKDYAYQHGPTWLQMRMESREMDRMASEQIASFPDAPTAFVSGPSDALQATPFRPADQHIPGPTETGFHYLEGAPRPDAAKLAQALDSAGGWRRQAGRQEPDSEERDRSIDRARNLIDHARNLREGFVQDGPSIGHVFPEAVQAAAVQTSTEVWEREWQKFLEAEPEPAVRLYRVGPTPEEARGTVSTWLREYEERTGYVQNIGRWFTSDEARAETFRADHPSSQMVHVDVPPYQASQWRADANPDLLRYTDNAKLDYFVPREVADTATRTFSERLEIPPPPVHQPTKTVDYIETHRYHDKHFAPPPIDLAKERQSRQQSWTWER